MPARFVVTHHLARADHYDLRLEIGGLLVSWAVPRGPSVDPAARRLAIRTEDHGLEHLEPEGVFGSSVVLLWDRGTFLNRSHHGPRDVDPATALDRGRLRVDLRGDKLRGEFSLVRTDRTGREMWLLMKRTDDEAMPGRDIVADEPLSVATGRSIDEIRAAGP